MDWQLAGFTQWFNRAHTRTGTLWEDRFKSVIVEEGVEERREMTKRRGKALKALKDLKDLGTAKMLCCRIRYFTEGAVIGG